MAIHEMLQVNAFLTGNMLCIFSANLPLTWHKQTDRHLFYIKMVKIVN